MTNESNFDLGPMDGYADQAQAADDVTGETYENMLDQGFTTPEREPNVERWENEHETLDERLEEEVPDVAPDSAYGNPDGVPSPDDEFDDTRVGRVVAPDEGLAEDRESELVAEDDGFAGGASSAEEAALHFTDGRDAAGFDDGIVDEPGA